MRKLALFLSLTMAAAPAFAGFGTFELPRLDWPTDDAITGSTKGCVAVPASPSEDQACR